LLVLASGIDCAGHNQMGSTEPETFNTMSWRQRTIQEPEHASKNSPKLTVRDNPQNALQFPPSQATAQHDYIQNLYMCRV
jgi:hypothetical protein